jgi:hypothetical protein
LGIGIDAKVFLEKLLHRIGNWGCLLKRQLGLKIKTQKSKLTFEVLVALLIQRPKNDKTLIYVSFMLTGH